MYAPDDAQKYNIKNMTLAEWFDSQPMRQARMMMFDAQRNRVCERCYHEESHGGTSRRHRANQKSVIFVRENFNDSWLQSPNWEKFHHSQTNQGAHPGLPIDLHIDLGNYCNLTCKMCRPQASSSIADQYRQWQIPDAERYIGTDWTRDQTVWARVLDELVSIPNLKNIHFMGGETLSTPKFEQFVDHMIKCGRQDLCFSFVTNGTKFNARLMGKLTQFSRVGIEVSIESLTAHNAYQRQGTDTQQVLENIDRYLGYCDDSKITVTLRPAVSLLTIGSYHTLLQYALDRGVLVKSLIVSRPAYLAIQILPDSVRKQYLEYYHVFAQTNDLDKENCDQDYNESDPHEIKKVIKNQVLMCKALLTDARDPNADLLLAQLVHWCKKWDQVHGLDALALYPELATIFTQHGYSTI